MAHRARRVSEETSLAIPVRARGRILASVTVRYAATAVPLRMTTPSSVTRRRAISASSHSRMNPVLRTHVPITAATLNINAGATPYTLSGLLGGYLVARLVIHVPFTLATRSMS